jgi:hypothetical protein
MLSYKDAYLLYDTRSHVASWVSRAQNAALEAHTLTLEDGPEIPDSSHPVLSGRVSPQHPDSSLPALPEPNRAGQRSSEAKGGAVIGGMYAPGFE